MPRKKKIEEKPLPLEEILSEEKLTEDFEDNEDETPKQRKRTRKDAPVSVFADGLQMKALYYITLFGVPDPPVFTNVIETEFEVEEDGDH